MLPFTCLGMILLSALYCVAAAIASLSKVLKPRTSKTNSENAAARRYSNTNDPDDIALELGSSVLDRMEEGRTALGN